MEIKKNKSFKIEDTIYYTFKDLLKLNGDNISAWIRRNIIEYIKEENKNENNQS